VATPSARISVFPQLLDGIGQQVGSTHTTMAAATSAADRLDLTEGTAGKTLAEYGYLMSYASYRQAFTSALRGNADSIAAAGQHMVAAARNYQQVDDDGVPPIRAAETGLTNSDES
jgi:hypothetical protein